jgi:hypothetical protein
MHYAVVIDQADGTMEEYGKVLDVLGEVPPAGRLAHAVGTTGAGLRFIEIWESREHARNFERDRLLPAFAQVLGASPSPRPEISELDVSSYTGAS